MVRLASVLLAVAVGACAATESGSLIYANVGSAERMIAVETRQAALERLPSGQSQSWQSADGRIRGTITVLRTLKAKDGQWCREIRETVSGAGLDDSFRAIFCRDQSGRWSAVAAGD